MAAGVLCGRILSEQPKTVEALFFSRGHTKVRHIGQSGMPPP